MAQYIDKDAVLAEIDKVMAEEMKFYETACKEGDEEVSSSPMVYTRLQILRSYIDTLEVKEANNVWHEVDNVNLPQPDKNKIYCVLSKNKYLLAKVIEHPHDELLQWKCTEFPFHRYDMCEGDKYFEIKI